MIVLLLEKLALLAFGAACTCAGYFWHWSKDIGEK